MYPSPSFPQGDILHVYRALQLDKMIDLTQSSAILIHSNFVWYEFVYKSTAFYHMYKFI